MEVQHAHEEDQKSERNSKIILVEHVSNLWKLENVFYISQSVDLLGHIFYILNFFKCKLHNYSIICAQSQSLIIVMQ